MLLFHHRKQLEKYLEVDNVDEDGDQPFARTHTKLAVDYMRSESEDAS